MQNFKNKTACKICENRCVFELTRKGNEKDRALLTLYEKIRSFIKQNRKREEQIINSLLSFLTYGCYWWKSLHLKKDNQTEINNNNNDINVNYDGFHTIVYRMLIAENEFKKLNIFCFNINEGIYVCTNHHFLFFLYIFKH